MSIEIATADENDVQRVEEAADQPRFMLRDERGHRVGVIDEQVVCPVHEHEPKRVVDLHTATLVWERDDA